MLSTFFLFFLYLYIIFLWFFKECWSQVFGFFCFVIYILFSFLFLKHAEHHFFNFCFYFFFIFPLVFNAMLSTTPSRTKEAYPKKSCLCVPQWCCSRGWTEESCSALWTTDRSRTQTHSMWTSYGHPQAHHLHGE